MRPSDRMPDEDFGPPPPLSEYFINLGLGLACMLVLSILVKIHEKVEDNNFVISVLLVLLELAVLLGAGFFLIPLVAVWYTWLFIVAYVLIIVIWNSITEQIKGRKLQQEQEIENKKWESIVSFDVYPSKEKPDSTKKPVRYMIPGRLECKTENGTKSYFVNRKYKIDYNPYYKDPSVGEWGELLFRYTETVDSLHKDVLIYKYFNLPEDVIDFVDVDHRFTRHQEVFSKGNTSESLQVIEDDLPF